MDFTPPGDDSSVSESENSHTTAPSSPKQPDIREVETKPVVENGTTEGAETIEGAEEGAVPPAHAINTRAYQLEMLEQSLKQNAIVAMDTGSGKTQVAILRIRAELERDSSGKFIWFLAPTVSLCAQQCKAIARQIPSAPIKLLTGNDNLDTWSPKTWQVILEGIQIVVSTFQVLLDALSHAYVKMESLSLLILDEAHNCVRKHPGSKIMRDFYHRDKDAGRPVPSILGLTASPSMRSQIEGVKVLEATLDAHCVSPTEHREELVKHANRPCISQVEFCPEEVVWTPTMSSLKKVFDSLDIKHDPTVMSLYKKATERDIRAAEKFIRKQDTFSHDQFRGLLARAEELSSGLGPWAATRFLWKTITDYQAKVHSQNDLFDQWRSDEKLYVFRHLNLVINDKPPDKPKEPLVLSQKVRLLITELLSVKDPVMGIIFVKERAMVTMLRDVLYTSSALKQRYKIGTVVGESNFLSRKRNIYDFMGTRDTTALDSFRLGKINLLIATSVLEEGIDVPACNLVICYDEPNNGKSFIQRRGRARMKDSRLVLFVEKEKSKTKEWLQREEEIREYYERKERERQGLASVEESEAPGTEYFEVPETGARIDFDTAKQHLAHFCGVLSRRDYVDNSPDYIIEIFEDAEADEKRLRATVLLPSFVPVELRRAQSKKSWLSERNATKDAALQAYIALYKAGLVNNNLMPFSPRDFDELQGREAEAIIDQQLNPWPEVAQLWSTEGPRWLYNVSHLDGNGSKIGEYGIMLPLNLGLPKPIRAYIDRDTAHELRFTSVNEVSAEDAAKLPDHTSTLLALHFNHRWPVEDREHVVKVTAYGHSISRDKIGSVPFDPTSQEVLKGERFIRDSLQGTPFFYDSIIPSKPPESEVRHPFYLYEEAPEDVPYLVLKRWTHRADFLHPFHGDTSKEIKAAKSNRPYPWVFPSTWARVDEIPKRHAEFGMLIPSILHEFEVMLIAHTLSNTILKPLKITDTRLIREAISFRGAAEPYNYERLEFVGDSLLKFCTVVQVFAEYPKWHEGYLSFKKDSIVSNERLSRATKTSGLAKFIIAKAFTGHKWRPLYLEDLLSESDIPRVERKLSTKILADVIEALIGAAYENGGIQKALKCMSLFLPGLKWNNISTRRDSIYAAVPEGVALPSALAPVEDLLGYPFKRKYLLVEALTHASYTADTTHRSLDRLELLGDAVLDYIVVTSLLSTRPPLTNSQMHLLKTAMVNADFLAFICLERSITHKEALVVGDNKVEHKDKRVALWQFLRHASSRIALEQEETTKRFEILRGDMLAAMEHGTHYPWVLLTRLRADKTYSDMIEALIGAVWVDSGSDRICRDLLDRLGIMPYLSRLLRDKTHVLHPKEELGVLAVDETVTYEIQRVSSKQEEEQVEIDCGYRCSVRVGERMLAVVEAQPSKEEACVMAADEAVRKLKQEREERASEVVITGV